jgi:hypothetical protein
MMVLSAVAFFALPPHPSRRTTTAWGEYQTRKSAEAYERFQSERRRDSRRDYAIRGALLIAFMFSTCALLKNQSPIQNESPKSR